MTSVRSRFGLGILLVVVLVVSSAARAQTSIELRHRDGALVAVGLDYQVRFGAGDMQFTASNGASLRFTLEEFGRGVELWPVDHRAARAEVEEDTVRYVRPGLVETYRLVDRGVKQSFVVAELPPGSGDLVVRGRIDSSLPTSSASACEVRFGETGGERILHIGAVTGFDARGATVHGSMRYTEGVLEMSLPAEFVEGAALPLVLDPLIGSSFQVGSAAPYFGAAAMGTGAAYDPVSGQYLAVWDDPFGALVQGRRYDSQGNALGAAFSLPNALDFNQQPSVAYVDGASRWVVSTIGFDCVTPTTVLTSVDASGATSSPVRLSTWPMHGTNDVGGGPGGTNAVVVFDNWNNNELELVSLDVPTMTLGGVVSVGGLGVGGRRPAIASHGGVAGRYLVTWQRGTAPSDIVGMVVDRQLQTLVAPFPITTGGSAFEPDVDGDGSDWLVAFQRGGDIECVRVTYDGPEAVTVGQAVVAAGSPKLEYDPAVAWMGESHLIGYRRQFAGQDHDIWVTSVESWFCAPCEGTFQVTTSILPDIRPSVASQAASGGDEALILWNVAGELPITRAQRFRAADGAVTDLGGGCGLGGKADVTCAAVPGNFGLRTKAAAPSAPALLIFGAQATNLPCGPCTLVPRPLVTLAVMTDPAGEALVQFPMTDPALVGGTLLVQWLVVGVPGGCLGNASFSNALSVTIEGS